MPDDRKVAVSPGMRSNTPDVEGHCPLDDAMMTAGRICPQLPALTQKGAGPMMFSVFPCLLCASGAGGCAFIFFFSPAFSPDFEGPEFKAFCEACYKVRARVPTLTLSALRNLLLVAAAGKPMTIGDLAEQAGQAYAPTALMVGQLSEGRGSRQGLGLLGRIPGADRRQVLVLCRPEGLEIAAIFAPGPESAVRRAAVATRTDREYLAERVLPALAIALQHLPGITLGTFCVLLKIAEDREKFAFGGQRTSEIARSLGISNLPRHLAVLSHAGADRSDQSADQRRLVVLAGNPQDARAHIPKLTFAGIELLANVAAALCGGAPREVRVPKDASLEAARSPDEVSDFEASDYDVLPIEPLTPPDLPQGRAEGADTT